MIFTLIFCFCSPIKVLWNSLAVFKFQIWKSLQSYDLVHIKKKNQGRKTNMKIKVKICVELQFFSKHLLESMKNVWAGKSSQ